MERNLVIRLKAARDAVEKFEEILRIAKTEAQEAEHVLIDYLEGKRASATGKYDGVWVQIQSPRLFASAAAEVLPALFEWLRSHEQASAIKETVHPSTLSQIVSEQLKASGELPPGVTYYLKPVVRLYGG